MAEKKDAPRRDVDRLGREQTRKNDITIRQINKNKINIKDKMKRIVPQNDRILAWEGGLAGGASETWSELPDSPIY